MNKKVFQILLHVPVWLVVLSLIIFMSSDSKHLGNSSFIIAESLSLAFWFLSSFYVFYFYLVPKYLAKKDIKKFVLYSGLFSVFIMPIIQLSLTAIIFRFLGEGDFRARNFPSVQMIFPYMGGIAGTLFCGGLGTFYRFGIDWFRNMQVKKDLENKNLLSELNTLKSKLNPHFLFNSLNNIDTLIQTNQEQASSALSKLSDLLRYVVYDTENEKVSIQMEIENIQKYIELEKIRLINPDSVNFKYDVPNKTMIPPMLFFPFIENGFKHSNLNNPEHNLSISISSENNKINFISINTITDKSSNSKEGIGLDLARKRLELLFPDSHKLDITKDKNMFKVNLEIRV